MHVKSEDFLYIEKCIATVKSGIDVKLNLDKVANTLNRLFELELEIDLVENDIGSFFGVNMYPGENLLRRITANVVGNHCKTEEVVAKWYENKHWYIEIDSILLSEFGLNASPAEVTALILHELANVIYFDRIPIKFANIVRYNVIGLNYTLKTLSRDDKIRTLFYFALIEACTAKNYKLETTYGDNDPNEFIYKHGYRQNYEDFVHKLINTFGNSLVDRSDKEVDKDIRSIVNWCITNIKQLELRKQSLRLALKTEMLKTPSYYIKKMTQDIYRGFFGSALDEYRVLLSESYREDPKDVYGELVAEQYLSNHVKRIIKESYGNLWDKKGKLKKITQVDIDVLQAESERIESVDDKIYLLDKLHSQYELVLAGLEYIESGDRKVTEKVTQSKATLEGFKKELELLRSKILATKIIEKHYGIYYRVPASYNG